MTHVLVDVGDRVQKGQLLLRLNDAILGADGQQIQAQIQESQSALELAQENYSRSERLEQQGFISSQQLLRDKSQLEQAKARFKAVKASYTSSITRRSQTAIYAPDSGIISARTVAVGDLASSAEMLRIVLKERYQWIGSINSSDLLKLSKGMRVQIDTPLGPIEGNVTALSPTVDSKTRQGQVFVTLDSEQHKDQIKPGMLLRGSIYLGEKSALTVPKESLIFSNAQYFIFTYNSQNSKVSAIRVTPGDMSQEKVALVEYPQDALNIDTPIVVKGAAFLRNQDTVHVVPDPTRPFQP